MCAALFSGRTRRLTRAYEQASEAQLAVLAQRNRQLTQDLGSDREGLEEQLLGAVIRKEQRSLEESLKNVLEDVNNNTKALLRLNQMLLVRLSENTGNLLDDEELINVLRGKKPIYQKRAEAAQDADDED